MSSLNRMEIIGRVGKDPDVRFMQSGEAVATVNVATSERWKDKVSGEQREETEWHRCVAFGRLAEIMRDYVQKGALLYLSGKLKTRKWTDKDGIERWTTEINVQDMKMLTPKGDGGGQGRDTNNAGAAPQQRQQPAAQRQAPQRQPAAAGGGFDSMDDDIPF